VPVAVANRKALSILIVVFFFFFALHPYNDAYTRSIFTVNQELVNRYQKQYGPGASERITKWIELINNNYDADELKKLEIVNDFFNKLKFIDDIIHWKQEDCWATPAEFLASGAGDCEDFAISKFYTLIKMDVSEKKLTLTYTKSITLNQAHMVLTYYPSTSAQPLILDNIDKKIKPSMQRTDLLPVYSLNGTGLWIAKQRGKGKLVGDGSNLKKWNELISKLEKEGFTD
jgi:predicted transglutaminase-like cysteine proteinase